MTFFVLCFVFFHCLFPQAPDAKIPSAELRISQGTLISLKCQGTLFRLISPDALLFLYFSCLITWRKKRGKLFRVSWPIYLLPQSFLVKGWEMFPFVCLSPCTQADSEAGGQGRVRIACLRSTISQGLFIALSSRPPDMWLALSALSSPDCSTMDSMTQGLTKPYHRWRGAAVPVKMVPELNLTAVCCCLKSNPL